MGQAEKLRELASWYRDYADRAGSAMIRELRLRTAEDLEREAERLGCSCRDLPEGAVGCGYCNSAPW